MTEFERTLRDHLAAAYDDICCSEDYTPAELDAYRLGSAHAFEEARALFEVELARAEDEILGAIVPIPRVHEEVRTTFALEWEQGQRASGDLRIVDETLEREIAIYDAMADCE